MSKELSNEEQILKKYLKEKNVEDAVKLLFELTVRYAKKREFIKAESLMQKISEVDPMALSEVFEAGEIILQEKNKAIDKNHDGKLTRSEMDQRNSYSSSGRAIKRFDRMDADGDGSISWEELQIRDGEVFSKIDLNRDGHISKEELSEIGSGRSPDPLRKYIMNTMEKSFQK